LRASEFFGKHWGDLASVLSLFIAAWAAVKAKTAAAQARSAVKQVKERISSLDTVAEISTAITIMQEIMRLQRTHTQA
jgi:hypothetical protein